MGQPPRDVTVRGVGLAPEPAPGDAREAGTAATLDAGAGGGSVATVDLRPAARRDGAPRIPGYRVRGVLGEGGMGTVYDAEQIEPQRRVAIKVLHARSDTALLRFKTEAQIMARLDHPSIARVLAAGDADGHPFLVMEHVDGVTLERHAPGLPLRRRLALFVQLCDAVHHAHVKAVIHRDLKPSNVMVRGVGTPDERVVVLDFGVARLAAADGETPGATRAGELVGTPLYMSPEQARLRADEVDARSDVYTLGVMLYELACDALPYEVRGLPLPGVTVVICEDPPVPLGARVPALRGDLEAITTRALAKVPAERYPSVAALADDVRRFLDGRPVSVRSPGAVERAARFVRRRPLVAAAIAGGALAAATFTAVVTGLWLDARAARRTAETARGVAEVARAELERHANALTLGHARAALTRDPTEALGWLATLTPAGVDPDTAWQIADEARARGVAHDVLRGHADEVHHVEPLPGGAAFVTAGYDGRALAWTGEPDVVRDTDRPADRPAGRATGRDVVPPRAGRVHAVRASPDGAWLAVGGDAGDLVVTGGAGAPPRALPGHAGDVQHLAWSSDGAWLVTGDDRGAVIAWPRGAAPGRPLAAGPAAVGALAVAATGAAVVVGDRAGGLALWDLAAGRARTAQLGRAVVDAWTDGARVVAVTEDGAVETWRAAGAGLVREGAVATRLATKRAAFGPAGAWVVLGGVGGAVTRVEGAAIEALGAHPAQVRSVAVSPDGRWIADGGEDGSLALRDRARGRVHALRGHRGRIRHLAFAGGGAALLSADSEGVVRRWDLAGLPATLLDAAGAPVVELAVAADGAWLAAIDAAGAASAWRLADGAHRALGAVTGRATEVAFAGATVVSGTTEGEVTWWRAPAPVRQRVPGVIKAIATSADRVAVASASGAIALFDHAGAAVAALPGHAGGTDALAFDPSGAVLASGGQDRVIRTWRAAPGGFAPGPVLDPGLRGDTHFVRFTPRGDLLVVAGNDGRVLAWRVRAGVVDAASQVELARHVGAVTALALDPAGAWVASAGRDATVARARLGGDVATARLSAPGIALAVDADGAVHAVTRTGGVERWAAGAPVREIAVGAVGAVALPDGGRWVVAFDDGTLLSRALASRPLAALAAELARATTVTAPAAR